MQSGKSPEINRKPKRNAHQLEQSWPRNIIADLMRIFSVKFEMENGNGEWG
jgi:hypothetical protein